MERPTCGTCPYFNRWDGVFRDRGECRVRPPSIRDGFPTTCDAAWCGRHPRMDAYIAATRDDCAKENQP
jgi:hypothetical protein